MTPTYTHEECLDNSYKINWRIDEVLHGREFDVNLRWLPERLSGAGAADCLDETEKRKLSHVEMAAYAHLFAYTEGFIAPTVTDLARSHELDNRGAFDALTNFAAEEVKHMTLFRRIADRVNTTVGHELQLLSGAEQTAGFVMAKNRGAVLLLIANIEWFTQRHYQECFENDASLDPFTKHIFKCHWLEESQHARMDNLETLRFFASASAEQAQSAVDDLIELILAVDGMLQTQSDLDIANLSRYLSRSFTNAERDQLFAAILKAKRFTFLESGVTHPRFQELFQQVTTPDQQMTVATALQRLFDAPIQPPKAS